MDERGAYVPNRKSRRALPPLPDFHSLRHTAAMDFEDAETARDLLRHKNSNVTRTVYRNHFDDRRREELRAKLEARAAVVVPAPAEDPRHPVVAWRGRRADPQDGVRRGSARGSVTW